jgi:hypothetical protein
MSPALLQKGLQEIYELVVPHDVTDFLVTSPEEAQRLDSGPQARAVREKLLLQAEPGILNLSLYLDQAILDNLENNSPLDGLNGSNLEDFCLALEGVSHFLYLIWNAGFGRAVTLLEMELQAEIDKFVVTCKYMRGRWDVMSPARLMDILFRTVTYHEQMDGVEQRRYRDANNYAAQYCSRLDSEFMRARAPDDLYRELRRFYRLPREAKLKYINPVGGSL